MENGKKYIVATSKATPESFLTESRRSFYSALVSALGSAIGVALALPSVAYLFVGHKSDKTSNFVEAAKLAQLAVGKPQEVTFERTRVDAWRTFHEKVIAWVVRTDEKNSNGRGAKGAGHSRHGQLGQLATGGADWLWRRAAALNGWHEPCDWRQSRTVL